MNGVEILNSTEVIVESTSNWWLAGIVWIIVIAASGMIGYGLSEGVNSAENTFASCCVGALVGLLFWGLTCAMTSTPVVHETQYEITIDDSVSMKEFIDKYEIIEQRGEIYVVREKVE